MSISTEIERLQNAKESIKTSLKNKGIEVSDTTKLDEYPTLVDSIEASSGSLEDCFNPYENGVSLYTLLKNIPAMDISNVTNLNQMCYGLRSLVEFPYMDTSHITSMSTMFNTCETLTTIPLLNTSKVTDMSQMFQYCTNLTDIPLLDTSSVTNMSAMFRSCENLLTIPQFNTSNVTDMSQMFYMCDNLTSIPQLDTSKVKTMYNMIYLCNKLTELPLLDCSSVINISGVIAYSNNITTLGGFKDLGKAYLTTANANYSNYTLTLNGSPKLTHDSLMNVINNLYDIASAGCKTQKLVLGTTLKALLTEDEISIATNKGWTVS